MNQAFTRPIEVLEIEYEITPVLIEYVYEAPPVPEWPEPDLTRHLVEDREQVLCMAQNIYHEARGSTIDDQMATAHVVMNRVASHRFPDTPCEVVWQSRQFSWTHDGRSDTPRDMDAWHLALVIAGQVFDGNTYDITNGATHYHTLTVNPNWSRYRDNEQVIGAHLYMTLTR